MWGSAGAFLQRARGQPSQEQKGADESAEKFDDHGGLSSDDVEHGERHEPHVAGMVFDDLSDEEEVPEGSGAKHGATAHGRARMGPALYNGPNGPNSFSTLRIGDSTVGVHETLLPEPEPEAGVSDDANEGSGQHLFDRLRWEEQCGILRRLFEQPPPALVLGLLAAALMVAMSVSVMPPSGPAAPSVHAVMTVRGIDYQLLVADDALCSDLSSQLKVAFWASMKVPEDDIDIQIMQGSVRVHARLITPEGVDPADFVNNFPSADVRATVASAVKGTSNIQSCSVGPIDVDTMELLLAEPQEPATNDPATPSDLTTENSAAASTTPANLALEDGTAQGAWELTRHPPYHIRQTIDLLADEYTETHVSLMEKKFNRCALVGSSPMLRAKGHGRDIDSFDIVIRVNRVPTEEYYEDFGQRTDILYSNAMEMYSGEVTLMGNSDEAEKHKCGQAQCDYLAMVFSGDYGCDLEKLQKAWGQEVPFVLGCTTRNVTKAAYGFQLLESVEPTSGFMAFLTFVPLCHEFVLYGFAGDGAIDGHTEWKGHSLYHEHKLLHWIQEGQWAKIELPGSREWLLKHLPPGPDGKPAVHVVQS